MDAVAEVHSVVAVAAAGEAALLVAAVMAWAAAAAAPEAAWAVVAVVAVEEVLTAAEKVAERLVMPMAMVLLTVPLAAMMQQMTMAEAE